MSLLTLASLRTTLSLLSPCRISTFVENRPLDGWGLTRETHTPGWGDGHTAQCTNTMFNCRSLQRTICSSWAHRQSCRRYMRSTQAPTETYTQKYCEYVNTCWWTGDWKRSLCLFYKRTLINTACFENGQQNQKHLPRIWKHRTVSPGNSPPSLCRQPQTQTGCRSVPTVEEKRCAKERQLADQSTSRRCVYRCVQYAPWQTLAVLTSLQHWAETQFEIANNRIEN